MNTQEFSSGFDTLLDSYAHQNTYGRDASEADIRVDEYEKSVFLTQAQEEVALSLYNGRNSSLQGFEETEELRRYLSNLVEEAELSPLTSTSGKPIGIDSKSKFFTLPQNLWMITCESVLISDGSCESHTTQDVYPVRQDEYHKIKKNPFRGANSRRALRLDLSENNVEIVSKYNVTTYYVRYLRRLKPIIVAPLDDQSIEGISTVTECEMPVYLHQRILERAVDMAVARVQKTRNNNNRE